MEKRTWGILSTVCASVLFGINPSVQNFLLLEGISPIGCTFAVILSATIFLFIGCICSKTSLRLSKEQILPALLCGFCIFLTDWLLEVSYTMIPVGFATMIHFLYPAVICLGMTLLFHEKINQYKIMAICLSFGGLALISGGGRGIRLSGVMVALVTSVAYASFLMLADKTALKSLPSLTFSFYANLINLFFCLLVLMGSKASVPSTFSHFKFVLLSGILLACATAFQKMGVRFLGSSDAAFISMLEPLTSVAASVFFFAYELSFFSLTGCILILFSLFFAERNH